MRRVSIQKWHRLYSTASCFCAASVVIAVPSLARTLAMSDQEDYNNARFGYHLAYPRKLLRPLPEADNGDGRQFQPVEGHAKILVWGGWYEPDVGQSLAGRVRMALKDCGGIVTYRLKRPDFEVLSCALPTRQVYYIKLMQGKDEVVGLELTYPQAEKSRWDPVAAAMSKSLEILGPPTPVQRKR